MTKKINITTIGWWKWSYSLLSSLRWNENYNLSAIISMADSGWSTGILREEFGILPPGDVRRWVMALSEEREIIKHLFDYRYDKDCSVSWHSLWNLIITAMADITGSFDTGLKEVCKMFKVKGSVIPVTLELSHMCVRLENGQIIKWEANIDEPKHDSNLKIEHAFLEPEVKANPDALEAIENSDLIIISFWDLYSSIIPNLLVKGIKEAIKASKAKVVYTCNMMTKKWETNGYEVIDFVDTIEKYLGEGVLDYVVVNDWYIHEKLIERYERLENKKPVKVKDISVFEGKPYKVLQRDLLYENEYEQVRYSYEKTADVIAEIVEEINKED